MHIFYGIGNIKFLITLMRFKTKNFEISVNLKCDVVMNVITGNSTFLIIF